MSPSSEARHPVPGSQIAVTAGELARCVRALEKLRRRRRAATLVVQGIDQAIHLAQVTLHDMTAELDRRISAPDVVDPETGL